MVGECGENEVFVDSEGIEPVETTVLVVGEVEETCHITGFALSAFSISDFVCPCTGETNNTSRPEFVKKSDKDQNIAHTNSKGMEKRTEMRDQFASVQNLRALVTMWSDFQNVFNRRLERLLIRSIR